MPLRRAWPALRERDSQQSSGISLRCCCRRWLRRRGRNFTTDVAQLQLDSRAIDLTLRIRSKRGCKFRACALGIALRDQRVAANLMRLRGECAGLLDVQQLQ